jgi:hypothetical protein
MHEMKAYIYFLLSFTVLLRVLNYFDKCLFFSITNLTLGFIQLSLFLVTFDVPSSKFPFPCTVLNIILFIFFSHGPYFLSIHRNWFQHYFIHFNFLNSAHIESLTIFIANMTTERLAGSCHCPCVLQCQAKCTCQQTRCCVFHTALKTYSTNRID